MSVPVKLAVFAVAVLAAFAGGLGVGNAVGGDDEQPPAHDRHEPSP